MKFNTIRDFLQLATVCPFCQRELGIEIVGKNFDENITNAFNNTMKVTYVPWSVKQHIQNAYDNGTVIRDTTKATYSSRFTDTDIAFYVGVSSCQTNNLAFRIELDTNKVFGNTESVQRLIWHHELCISRTCTDKKCNEKHGFQYQSSPIVLERNFNRICPFFLNAELLCVIINDAKYCLITPYEIDNSYLIDSKNIIATLPRMSLHSFKDGNAIISKIKTLILFS